MDNKNIFLLEILMKQTKFDAADLTLHPLVHTPETDQGHKDILMTLLNAGANVNSRDRASGRTLLHLAVLMVRLSRAMLCFFVFHPGSAA